MNKLCCVLNCTWICLHCDWKLCTDEWTGSSIDVHNLRSPKCVLSKLNKEQLNVGLKYDGTPHTLSMLEMLKWKSYVAFLVLRGNVITATGRCATAAGIIRRMIGIEICPQIVFFQRQRMKTLAVSLIMTCLIPWLREICSRWSKRIHCVLNRVLLRDMNLRLLIKESQNWSDYIVFK
jgi:hypothetical protein